MNKTESLLEKAGNSYSGIHNLIQKNPENSIKIFKEINTKYSEAKKDIAILEETLCKKTESKAFQVSNFLHLLDALNKDIITIVINKECITVKKINSNTIDYETINVDYIYLTE